MFKNSVVGKWFKKIACFGLSFIICFLSFSVSFAIDPLPGPGNPLMYDDFNNGGTHKYAWANWWNGTDGTTASWSKEIVEGRYVGKFTQTPASGSSISEFQPQSSRGDAEYANFYGYRYLTFIMKNPGYPDLRVKIEIKDSNATYQLSGGFISVPEDWTTFNFDMDQFPNLNKKSAHIKIILKQTGGNYGELLIDDIMATSEYSGNQPILTDAGVNTTFGDENTLFTFNVTYVDPDNQKPINIQLVLDDAVAIELNEADHGDLNYADGKRYTYSTKLDVGNHTYYFRAADGTSDQVATASQNINVISSIQVIDINDNTTGTGLNEIFYSDSHFTYSAAGEGSYQSDEHFATEEDAYLTFKFIGTNVSIYGARDPANGIAAISIDGGAELYVDCYAPSRKECELLYTSPELKKGLHTVKLRVTGTKNDNSTGTRVCIDKITAAVFVGSLIESINVSQAGYSAGDYKLATVTATSPLLDKSFSIMNGDTVLYSGTMKDEGYVWGKYVYSIDFSSFTQTGTGFTIESNNVSSYPFDIQNNIWSSYKDEMTAFYRLNRLMDTTVSYPQGYSDIAPSQKVFHPDCFLDDAVMKDAEGNVIAHYDLTGGWQDAGDYGKYGGNQWVGGEIALAYIRHAESEDVNFDNDGNGIPDLIDEAVFGCEYLIKFAEQFNGALYNINRAGGFIHPEKVTDNIVGTADDRKIDMLSVGGSGKAAGTLAATARAINIAINNGNIQQDKIPEMQLFAAKCADAAVTCYNFAINNPDGNQGSYSTVGGIPNTLLWAEVELYLLTNEESYKNAATSRLDSLTSIPLRSTNYWDMRPMTLIEFYPVADTATQTKIKKLLDEQMEYFVSLVDDTPYGTLNEFKNFGVNEPLASYIGDAIRYNELFPDPEIMRAALKGLYWIFGNNPWNISWVSGIGTDYVDFLHTRLDEESYSSSNRGIVIPGAMVSGPNMSDTLDKSSESPWYMDRSLKNDDLNQWRYNEYSISINVGLLYSIMALTGQNFDSIGGTDRPQLVVLSPNTEDLVTGTVTIFVKPTEPMNTVESNVSGSYTGMNEYGGVYTTTIELPDEYYAFKRYTVKGTDDSNRSYYSSVQFKVAPPLPDPSHPLVYDDFSGGGTYGSQGSGWQNWYTASGASSAPTTGKFTQKNPDNTPLIVDGRYVGKFSHEPSSTKHETRFQPWHDRIDVSGYRYLTITMKNPGYPNTQVKVTASGGYFAVPDTWTTFSFDLDAAGVNKQSFHPQITLRQFNEAGYGEILIDEICFTNEPYGSAPVISDTSVYVVEDQEVPMVIFNATYTDADNQPPFKMQVVIDGVIRDMIELDATDTTYHDGKQYTYSAALDEGIHSYYFRTTDTTSDLVVTETDTIEVVKFNPVYEAENLSVNAVTTSYVAKGNGKASGGKYVLFNAYQPGDFIEYKVNVPQAGTYNVTVRVMKWSDNGVYRLMIDGADQGTEFDTYQTSGYYKDYDLGEVTFTDTGEKIFRFTCTGKNASSVGYKLPLDYIMLTKR